MNDKTPKNHVTRLILRKQSRCTLARLIPYHCRYLSQLSNDARGNDAGVTARRCNMMDEDLRTEATYLHQLNHDGVPTSAFHNES